VSNASSAQATVKLYFTQLDFDHYNAYIQSNSLNVPLLPTGPADNPGIANIIISQVHGEFSSTTDPSTATKVTPITVRWDNSNQWWEVEFFVNGFSRFYLGTQNIALPLSLIEFKGRIKDNAVVLEWATSNEVNTKEFLVERGGQNIAFFSIGKVSGQSTPGTHQYSFTDAKPSAGNNFYRLRIMDKDGKFANSNTVQVKIKDAEPKLLIFPNPIGGHTINLQFISQLTGVYTLRLRNELGQVILTKLISHSEGSSMETLELNNSIQKGNYVLEITGPDKSKRSFKVIY
jgi:hypothetical protein